MGRLCGKRAALGTGLVLAWQDGDGPTPEGDRFMSTEIIHPVDEILPTPRLLALGLQHVLVMYAGAVAVPLIIGRALKLSPEEVAFLISADLFACGIGDIGAVHRLPRRRYPASRDDGRHFRLGRPDAVDGSGP